MRAMRVRENFVATVSHDLKNPLNAIRMSAEVLATTVPPEALKDRAQKNNQLVRRSVERMTRIIGDLLDASAIDAGHLSVERRQDDAHLLVKEAVDASQPLAVAKRQTLRTEATEPMPVLCDRERVLQVLSNLIGNAIKFTEETGEITVRAGRVEGAARFAVEDRGPGIEPGQLRHVFERYWHARSKSGGGTGLGLFIAKGIVEAHGGRIWVESNAGAGSTFFFTLPLGEQLRTFERASTKPVGANP